MFLFSIWISFSSCLNGVTSYSCGIDNSPEEHVNEGVARIETYPWLGVLYYPYNRHKYTVAVVLVTKQIVLAAANEIDKLPKNDFRARARVVIGHNCTGPSVRIRDYTYHPDYSKNTYSTLAMIQLETDHVKIKLRPICPPPTHFRDQDFFAMVLSNNCKRSKMRIFKMNFVTSEQCRTFYRRSGLDVDTLWPTHTACARSMAGGHCVWRSGAILVVKVGKRWRLLGFSVYGPGCQAPARFLDYGMYHEWVQRSIERIGRPSVTALAENHVVLRRTQSNVQRFGPCDQEERAQELYTDETYVSKEKPNHHIVIYHNVTLVADVEYSCVIFKADYSYHRGKHAIPKLRLRRWCAGGTGTCHGFGFIEINFSVEITFEQPISFRVVAYGRVAKFIHQETAYIYLNRRIAKPLILDYKGTKDKYRSLYLASKENQAFGKGILLPPKPPEKHEKFWSGIKDDEYYWYYNDHYKRLNLTTLN